jgi:hypothetical protein
VTKARQASAIRRVFSGRDEALAAPSYLLAALLAPVPPSQRGAAQLFNFNGGRGPTGISKLRNRDVP